MDVELQQGAINALERLIQGTRDELMGYEKALAALRGTIPEHRISPPISTEWEHLGVTDAAVKWLEEHGASATRDIAEGMRDRGVRSSSKKFSNVVYATLKGGKQRFQRTDDGLWALVAPPRKR